MSGITSANSSPEILYGPDGARAAPPALYPAQHHVLLLDEPCQVSSLVVGQPGFVASTEISIRILGADGDSLWEGHTSTSQSIEDVPIPAESGLCAGSGPWTVQVDSTRDVIIEALDNYNGLQFIGGQIETNWLFGGLPRDRYGSIDVSSRLLLHNPSDEVALVSVRLITSSASTTSEISIGLQPGETVVEPLPVFGASAISIVTIGDSSIAAGLYGVVDGNRYRIPPSTASSERYSIVVPGDAKYDAGTWLTLLNPTQQPISATLETKTGSQTVNICQVCGVPLLVPATSTTQSVTVTGVDGAWLGLTAVAYQERTGKLHYDIGLPLLAAPLALFDETWTVLLMTALAGIMLAPGLFLLLKAQESSTRVTFYIVAAVAMLAPISTYAVRFYTDLIAATMLVWALVLWERSWTSNRALVGVAAIGLALPILHGRLALLAAGLLGLGILAAYWSNRARLARYPRRVLVPVVVLVSIGVLVASALLLSKFAVALGGRGIGNFFRLNWVMPNTFGMLLDRGSGVLPFAPWVVFALAVPRPLHRTQRAALALTILYYGLLTLVPAAGRRGAPRFAISCRLFRSLRCWQSRAWSDYGSPVTCGNAR